jgi:phospholipid/cholesterol/gamma-HCH transport system substrate-binding protein
MKRLLAIITLTAVVGLSASCNPQTAGALKGHLTLIADFNDAQHLVPGHSVRVGDVQVGSVTKVQLNGYKARVTMSIADNHRIPVGTTPTLGLSSLLGENFIALNFPAKFDPQRGPFLKSGAVLPNSTAGVQLEDIAQQAIVLFGAISGGDLSTIVNTAAQAVNGRGNEIRQIVVQLAQVGEVYAGQATNMAAVIDGLAKLGASLSAHASDVGALIGNLSDATTTLSGQRDRIIGTVQKLTQLAQAVNDHVLVPHSDQIRFLLSRVAPVLTTVAGDRNTLETLITNVAAVTTLLQKNVVSGDLLLYAWFSKTILPGGATLPPSATGTAAITALLRPVV